MSKSRDAFRTISEVAEELGVPKHVLRFWEAKFPQIRPMKRGGGRRYYRPEDMELLVGIRHLLHAEGYTIKGVSKILRDQGVDHVKAAVAANVSADRGERRKARKAKALPQGGVIEGMVEVPPPGIAGLSGKQTRADIAASLEAVIRELQACRAILSGDVPSGPEAQKRERRTATGRM
jgi:DNA-binding transcriptional MerR regulator